MSGKRKVMRFVVALVGSALVLGAAGIEMAASSETRQHDVDRSRVPLVTATPGSPAHIRLVEEQDRDGRRVKLVTELEYLARVVVDADPGFPARFRAREELERLDQELRRLNP